MSIESKILLELARSPRTKKELKRRLGNDRKVNAALQKLQARGQAVRRGEVFYAVEKKKEGIACVLVKLGRSFGFAQPVDGSADIFVPGRCLLGAMPGDEVQVTLFDHPRVAGSREGEVVAITAPRRQVVGTVTRNEYGRLAIVPDNAPQTPILLKRSGAEGVQPGDKAAAEIVFRADNHEDHRAVVVERFGAADSAANCAKALLFAQDVQVEFPEEVMQEAAELEGFAIPAGELARRLDLREEAIFTIDSASTKDIDDAISLQTTESGWLLGVHIADVSWFVQPHSALDREAFKRGTSVYYADSVAPMLPGQLSNGVCSLNPGEDRLAFSCLMKLDRQGGLQEFRFEKTVIRSRVKGVYAEINRLLAGEDAPELAEKYAEVAAQLPEMEKVFRLLAAARRRRGGMEIESGESKLELDENGRCVGVHKAVRGEAEEMIEAFMLLANTCAAIRGRSLQLPFVYRVHEAPDEERVARLRTMLGALGVPYHFAQDAPDQHELEKLLDETRGTPLERAVHTGVLRAMSKAKYEPLPKGHFSLALADYAHFTSPIRRYPDLAIHRGLSALWEGCEADALKKRFERFCQNASAQSSQRELAALQVERGVESCYKAEYMRGHIGEEFVGVVSGLAAHGLYVELPDTVEGLVHARLLSAIEPVLVEGVSLADPLTGRSWRLGDEVKVKCIGASVPAGTVDFALAQG